MKYIGTFRIKGQGELDAIAIRGEVERFAALLEATGCQLVRVWCSYNPDLPDDSPLQSPQQTIAPNLVLAFFDNAVRNGVWKYGDYWSRAGIDDPDGAFTLFLGNDKDITLETDRNDLLDPTRSKWFSLGFELHEGVKPRAS